MVNLRLALATCAIGGALLAAAPAQVARCGGDFNTFIASMSAEAAQAGISQGVISQALGGVSEVVRTSRPYTLAGRDFRPENTVVRVGAVEIGGGSPVVMAGPCSVESEAQILATARAVWSTR